MANSLYTTLTRQSGLMSEMRVVANNIANAATTGFRSEGVVFAEHIKSLGASNGSLSMANAEGRRTAQIQGTLDQTGGTFDLAIEGEGFFTVETPQGPRLTRAGSFIPNDEGILSTPEGYPLLDLGGAPVFVPGDVGEIAIAPDGTLSAAGVPIGQVGLSVPLGDTQLVREDGVRFRAVGPVDIATDGRILQGFLENSNVNAIEQVSRMIEVQRAYELGQSFLEREDQRLRSILDVVGR